MCVLSSEHVALKICKNVHTIDSDVVIIEVRYLDDVLIPDALGCFSVDSTDEGIKCSFRNFYCPNKDGVLVLDMPQRGAYKFVHKDSIMTFSRTLSKGTKLKMIFSNILCIPVNTYKYQKSKKRIIKGFNIYGGYLYYIRDEEVRLLTVKNSLECFK